MRKTWAVALAAVFVLSIYAGGAIAAKGGTVSGSIELASTTLRAPDATTGYGDEVSFWTTVDGRLGPKSKIYVRVICTQDGQVVYQWSADPSFSFPLVQQDGLAAVGITFEPDQPAGCTAELMYREDGGQTLILVLDQVAFTVGGA